ncbi:AAA family ATPase, partial [Burkholderia sp. 3C]
MLRHLSIRDFVIVAGLDLEFDTGFSVFSGETGAGKSILIDALALALGERSDASVVRAGCQRADITAEFTPHDRVAQWLDVHAFDADDVVMMRRVIDANGRSRAFINGTSATLSQLRELGEMLVDVHGQHAHQLLMRPDAQREMFDTHAGLTADAAAVARAWRAWREALHQIELAQTHERELQLEREKLAWQLAELDKLAPQPGEWDEVNSEHGRLTHAANLSQGVQGALLAISESDQSMLGHLGAVLSNVRHLASLDPALNDVLASLDPAEIQLREASYSLSHYAQRLELDPGRLAQVEMRLDALHSAARRFRLPPDTLHDEHLARREQLAALDAAADLSNLQVAADRAREAYLDDARTLSAARA